MSRGIAVKTPYPCSFCGKLSRQPRKHARTCDRRPIAKENPMPEVTDTFTFICQCEAEVSVVGGVERAHGCPLTEAERQSIRDAAALDA